MAIKNNPLHTLARAKINLDLLITGRRADGYHLLDSLVVFADYGDQLSLEDAPNLTLDVIGAPLSTGADNLVLKAAKLMQEYTGQQKGGHFILEKNLPVASGIGGGSADAAAALKLCVEMWGVEIEDGALDDMALALGADVPVCLRSHACHMQGVGDKLSRITFAFPLYLLLANPGIPVSTQDIFSARSAQNIPFSMARTLPRHIENSAQLMELLSASQNDLENIACGLYPQIGDMIKILTETDGCLLGRMSGSGATCFGLYRTKIQATQALETVRAQMPGAWLSLVNAT